MTAPLKPCPFCGHPPRRYGTEIEGWLGCVNEACLVRPGVHNIRQGLDIVARWNTRPEATP